MPTTNTPETPNETPHQGSLPQGTTTTLEVKEEKNVDKLHAPLDVQYLLFDFDNNKEEHKETIATIRNKTGIQDIQRVNHITLPLSDSEVIGVNIDVPQLVSTDLEDIKLTSHERVITPKGTAMDIDHYHADGGTADDNRLAEQAKLQIRNLAWIEEQQEKAKENGNGTARKFTMGDFNVSAVEWDKEAKKLKWNSKFIKMLERMFPEGIYNLTLPSVVVRRQRGATDKDAKPRGTTSISNQTTKTEIVYDLKTIIVQLKTDDKGNLIKGFNPRDLYNYDPAEIFKIEDYTFSETLEDHKESRIIADEMELTCGGNTSLLGVKAFNQPQNTFLPNFLNEDGSLSDETITKDLRKFTELGNILNRYLNITKEDAFKALLSEEGYIGDEFSKAFNQVISKKAIAASEKNTLKYELKLALTEWFLSKEWEDFVLGLKKLTNAQKYPLELDDVVTIVDQEAVKELVTKIVNAEKNQFDEIMKFFSIEPSGGYLFRNQPGLSNDDVDNAQSKAKVANVYRGRKGEKCIVFGAESEEQNAANIKASYHFATESSESPKVLCKILPDNEFNEEDLIQGLKKRALASPNEHNFLFRFKGEFYYVNSFNNGEVRHIPKTTKNEKVYGDILVPKFVKEEKSNTFFILDVKRDKAILDMITDKHQIPVKGSKTEVYHRNIEKHLGITNSSKKIAIFGVFKSPKPCKLPAPAPVQEQSSGMDLTAS